MQTLDAVLAFAITMLILSMVVTTLVETLHRILRLRERGLELLLERFYDRVIAARNAGPRDPAVRTAFIQAMTANRAPAGKTPLGLIWAGRRLDELGVQAFMERLGGTPYGASIVNAAVAAGDQALTAALKDVSQKFEAFGREASAYFESRARLVSVIIGILLAIAVNVNAFTLFTTFMRNPDVAQAVIEKREAADKSYLQLQQRTRQVQESPASAPPIGGAASKAVPESGAKGASDDPEKMLQDARKKVDDAVKDLKGVGVPIGREGDVFESIRSSVTNARELLGLLLGGLLVGLGAPFWYRLVQGLMSLRSMLRGRSTGAGPGGDALQPASRAERAVSQPQTPIEAFVAAREAANVHSPLRPPEEPVG